MSKEIDPNITQLYQIKKILGSGAYGHVWRVIERQTGRVFALKKVFDAFHNDVDAQRTYREITVLHYLEHPNIIKLHKVLKAKNNKDLYLVFDFMEADLQSLVGQKMLQEVHVRFVIFQILKAIKYLHSAQLLHRDLKPSNILINSQCEVKLCDFGLVRSLTHQQEKQMILSEEVATRWYRSPEMLLGSKEYGKETDVWSVGCLIAEIVIGRPMFPGDSMITQLQKIIQFTGVPSKQDIGSLSSQTASSIINQVNNVKQSPQEYFQNTNKNMVEMIRRMLEFNPKKRITVDQALELDLFTEFKIHKANLSDICNKFIVPQIDDNVRLTAPQYRKMIYCDIERRYPEFYYTFVHKSHSLDRGMKKENKKQIIKNNNSLKRDFKQRSLQNLRQVGHHSVHSKKSNKNEEPIYAPGGDAIKKMKTNWKKSAVSTNLQTPNNSSDNSKNVSEADCYGDKLFSTFYQKDCQKQKSSKHQNSGLKKVRSRKMLIKTKSRAKMQLQHNFAAFRVDRKKKIR